MDIITYNVVTNSATHSVCTHIFTDDLASDINTNVSALIVVFR
jgi:hypothetical protein